MRPCTALAVCLWAATQTPAAPPPLPPEQLVAQLGDRDYAKREAASRLLEGRLAEALPALRQASNHADPEVRQRAAALAAKAEQRALFAPRLITLHVDQRPIKEVVAALAKQTDYRIELQNDPGTPVSLHVDGMAFWPALEQVCGQVGLGVQPHHDGSGGIMLYAQGGYAPFVWFEGPFRLSATGFHASKSLNFATLPSNGPTANANRRSDGLTLSFSVIAEPRLPLLGVGQPRLATAEDDTGASLVPPPTKGNMYETRFGGYFGYRNHLMQSQVALVPPGGAARAMRAVKGSLPVTVLADTKPEITIDNILDVKTGKYEGGSTTLEIEGVKEGPGKAVQITASLRRPSSKENQMDYSWTNSLHQRVELTDAKGNKFTSQGFNWNSGSPTAVSGTFMFADGGATLGKAKRLVLNQWITAQHQVEFEFRDLPLP